MNPPEPVDGPPPNRPSPGPGAAGVSVTAAKATGRFRRLRRFLCLGCAIAALVHPLATGLSRRFWLADLITHFQEPALVLSLASAAVAFGSGGRRLAAGLVVLAAFQVAPLTRYMGANPVPADPSVRDRLRILMANILYDNTMYEDLEHLIRKERPDVVGLVEYAPGWGAGLESVRREYPYRMEWPAGASGLALWFKEKPESIGAPEWPSGGGNPVIHATFAFAGRRTHLWLVHPTSPLKKRRWEAGNPEIDAIAALAAGTGGSRIVMGDMNSTDGSAHFRDFLKVSRLRDSRLGFGRQGSWPTDVPYRIAIDNLFLSDDLAVVSRRLGHMIGSDHFPLIVDLAPAVAANAPAQADQASTSR